MNAENKESEMRQDDSMEEKFLPATDKTEATKHGSLLDMAQSLANASMLRSNLLYELMKIKNDLRSITKDLPQAKKAVNKSAFLPKLPLTMDSAQSMETIIKNGREIFKIGKNIMKHAHLLTVENLEEALKRKQQKVTQMNQKLSILEDHLHTILSLVSDMETLRCIQKPPYSPDSDELSFDESSILTIRSEDVQGSSSVLEQSEALDFDDSQVYHK